MSRAALARAPLALVLLLAALATGCGLKGDLYLEEAEPAVSASAPEKLPSEDEDSQPDTAVQQP